MIIPDKNEVFGILNEPYKQFQPKTVVKLKCGHGNVEVEKFGDQYLECGTCKKKYLLVNNRFGSKKIYE